MKCRLCMITGMPTVQIQKHDIMQTVFMITGVCVCVCVCVCVITGVQTVCADCTNAET